MSIKIGSTDITDIKIGSTNINYVYSGSTLVWQRGTPPTPTENFYLTSDVDFNAGYWIFGSLSGLSIDYRIGETGSWTSWNGSQVSVSGGTKLYVRNNNTTLSTIHDQLMLSGNFKKVGGNLKYMLGESDTLSNSCFHSLFTQITSLQNASELILPWMTLADYCYNSMFGYCTSLTSCPALPATTLATYCYGGMFGSCTSLTSCPALPATTLADHCYDVMFNGCTSLETCPALPATTLRQNCYMSMFEGCTSLTSCPALPATTLADRCYYCMFLGCTSLTQLPALPATTLAESCYQDMFYGCSNIKLSTTQTSEYVNAYRIPTEGTGTTATSALYDMFIYTGGTFTGDPTINTTYYTSNEIIS